MNIYFALPIGIVVITFVAVLLYKISKQKSDKLTKYIPSILFAISIALVYFKMFFISKGYDAISDIVVIIFLSVGLGNSLLGAIIIEIINKWKETH
ncbi:hypothetical protein V7127_23575 [Bacillus sp. JJ1773]|uniref:hypothetical protein n=1 Tax=Bacillus sp. JJ1773 TaxID=3122965 RepID=UPI002FFE93A3